MKSFFWNKEQKRLRAFWRLFVFLIIAAAIANPLVLILDATEHPWLESSLVNPIIALAIMGAVWINARFIDRRPLSDFGLGLSSDWWRDLAIGFGVGAPWPRLPWPY